ncbi:MAG TPA: transglutaminase domain-containing protein [Gaiellaceae bacterium]|nr:transglutaminase domain-containing protein [Gaiellaceae bacterium]
MNRPRAALAIATVLTVVVLSAPSAEAVNRKPVAPGRAATRLRTELSALRATLDRATRELARARMPHRQMSQLGRTLNTAKGQLSAAETRSADLQAALRTPPLTIAVDRVRDEVAYVQGGLPYPRGQLVAEAAMDYVVGHVSDTEYGYRLYHGGSALPVDPNAALGAQAGICGHAAAAFAGIVRLLGFAVRHVNFSYTDPNGSAGDHVAVEVFYSRSWHYFDPTYGEIWTDAGGDVLSISEIRSGAGTLRKDVLSFTNVFEDGVFGNDTWFVTDPATGVAIGPTLAGRRPK